MFSEKIYNAKFSQEEIEAIIVEKAKSEGFIVEGDVKFNIFVPTESTEDSLGLPCIESVDIRVSLDDRNKTVEAVCEESIDADNTKRDPDDVREPDGIRTDTLIKLMTTKITKRLAIELGFGRVEPLGKFHPYSRARGMGNYYIFFDENGNNFVAEIDEYKDSIYKLVATNIEYDEF